MNRKNVVISFFIFVFICMFFSADVNAAELMDRWIVSGSRFYFNEIDSSVNYYSQTEKISLRIGEDSLIISLGECKKKEELIYCFDEVDQDTHGKYSDGKAYPGVRIRIKSSEPKITVKRDFSTKKPKIKEKVEVEVTISNTGDIRANNLILSESFPEGIELYSTNALHIGNGFKYEAFIDPDQEKKFKYVFIPVKMMEFDSVMHGEFSYSGNTEEIDSTGVKISVETPIEMDQNISSDAIKMDEISTYTIIIENTDSKDILIRDLKITVPRGLKIIRNTEGTLNGNIISFDSELRAGKKEKISIEVSAQTPGEYDITCKGEFISGRITFLKNLTQKIIASESDIIPFLEISPKEVISDELYKLTAKITNKIDSSITGIDIKISGPMIKEINLPNKNILQKDTLVLVDTKYNAPEVDSPTNISITMEGDYKNPDSGKMYEFKASDSFTIKPAEKIIDISTEAPTNVGKGEDFEFKVFIRNLKSSVLSDVSVATTIPKGIKITGNPYADINLGSLENKEAFSITMNIPEDYKENYILLNTIANAEYKGKFVKKTFNTRIDFTEANKIIDEKQETEKTMEKEVINVSVNGKTNEEIKEEGFFNKIIGWFKGLFS